MIKNEREYKVTRSRLDDISKAITELVNVPLNEGLQPGMRDLQLETLRGLRGDLESELAEYDSLCDATERFSEARVV
jgi:HTH-type transcriptional regulator / antitoxin HipB